MHLVSLTKRLLQKFRDDGWEPLLKSVNSFLNLMFVKKAVSSIGEDKKINYLSTC